MIGPQAQPIVAIAMGRRLRPSHQSAATNRAISTGHVLTGVSGMPEGIKSWKEGQVAPSGKRSVW